MSFYELASECQNLLRVTEATSMAAISFLPTQVGAVRSALRGLGRKKGQWNLEILEGDDETTVRFEDQLEIKVPQAHWDAFQDIFDGSLSSNTYLELSSVGLLDSMEESVGSVLEQRMAEIRSCVEKKLSSFAIQKASNIAAHWFNQFGGQGSVAQRTFEDCLVPLPLLEETVDTFTESLTEEVHEDLGQLEILLKKMSDFQSLRECSYLAGVRASCVFQGVQMVFEAHTCWDDTNTFSIAIGDGEVVDAVEEAVIGVRRIGNTIFPRGGQIDPCLQEDNLINVIKAVIEDDEFVMGDESNEQDSGS